MIAQTVARVAPEKAYVRALPSVPFAQDRRIKEGAPAQGSANAQASPSISVLPPSRLFVCTAAHIVKYFSFNIGDWVPAVEGMTASAEGLYLRMVRRYYTQEAPLTGDLRELCNQLGARTPRDIATVTKLLEKFFIHERGVWCNKKCDEEIAKYHRISLKNQANGRLGGRPKETQSVISGLTIQEPITNNQDKPQLRLVPSELTLDGPGEPEPPRLPDCPHEKIVKLYHEILPTCPRVVVWTDARQATLRAFWRAWGAKKGWKREADGIAFIERYLRHVAESRFLTGRAAASGERPPFVADLAWLIKPANFAKVVEGKFHQEQG